MKYLLNIFSFIIIISFFPNQAFCQIRAKTESGKNVYLYSDGTWKYVSTTGSSINNIYKKSTSSKKLFLTDRGQFKLWYDDSKWKLSKNDSDDRVTFRLISGDGYSMLISEGIGIPFDSLKDVFLGNAKEAAPDSQIVFEEKRIVNGVEILCMILNGTMKKIPFSYYGYFYSG